jgi:GAF domain-containing protein
MAIHKNSKPAETRQNVFARLWQALIEAHPSVQEIGERRRAQLLNTISLIIALPFITALFARPRSYDIFIEFITITGLAYIFGKTRLYRLGTYIFTYGITSLAYLRIYQGTANSFESSITTTVHISLIIASALLSQRGFLGLAILSTIATFTAPQYAHIPVVYDSILYRTGGLVFAISAVLYGVTVFRARIETFRLMELRAINTELEDLTTNLETRVNERTAELEIANQQTTRRVSQLQAITELSEAISQVRDLSELFNAATRLISNLFGFYHVGIFLVDSDREYAVMQAANSAGGQKMLQRNHRLKLGIGVVGFAAKTGQPRIALDVGTDAVFFDNPDLPETHSEAALPLKTRGETIGVLDVQSVDTGAFSTEDLRVLTALANQVSIALENARLLAETRSALKQVEEVYNEFTRAEWSRTVATAEQTGFRYQGGRIEMMEGGLDMPEVVSAVATGSVSTNQAKGPDERRSTLAVPVKLRGEVIGVLHIDSNDPAKDWQSDELSLVQAVAERAAFALENARLFQDARQRAAKERLISEATSRISGALNIENILQTTAQELERVLGGSEVLIKFQTKEQS